MRGPPFFVLFRVFSKICPVCKTHFSCRKSKTVFCGKACANVHQSETKTRSSRSGTCENCGRDFVRSYSTAGRSIRFCSPQCANALKPVCRIDAPYKTILARMRSNDPGCDLNEQDLKKIMAQQNWRCPLTGWELGLPSSKTAYNRLTQASPDRLDTRIGYRRGNVRFVVQMANYARNNFEDSDIINMCRAVCDHKIPCPYPVAEAEHRDAIMRRSWEKDGLTVHDVQRVWERQGRRCAFTNWPISFSGNGPLLASLDRIDTTAGYEKDNVQVVSILANLARNEFTVSEFLTFCHAVKIRSDGGHCQTPELVLGQNRTVYLVAGPPGVGKSWVCSQLEDHAFHVDTDKIRPRARRGALVSATHQHLPILMDVTVGVSTTLRLYPDLRFNLFIILEQQDVNEQRVLARGGVITPTIRNRINRLKRMAPRAEFVGTSSEVLAELKAKLGIGRV